jgi:hypothetical protein
VSEEKSEKVPPSLPTDSNDSLFCTNSFTISGLMSSVEVSCGCPKSMISSEFLQSLPRISYTSTKFFRTISSVTIPRKSLMMTYLRLRRGGASPLCSLTLRKKSSGVFFIRSERKSRLMIVSPLADKMNNCDIITYIDYYEKSQLEQPRSVRS